jgi:LPS sulfotransferase NodH
MEPRASYLICATPRSGSFLLCEALKDTGLAGRPEEYFWRNDEPFWSERWGVSSYAECVASAKEQGATPDGVFGVKVMRGYVNDFLEKLRRAYDEANTARESLSAVFPDLRYVWISRRDKLRQAVSFSKAIQTRIWARTEEDPASNVEPEFRFEEIRRLVRELTEHDDAWQAYFEECGQEPLKVTYEVELENAYEETALRMLEFLEIPVPSNIGFGERRLKKQADGLSERWVRRYREMEWRRA